LNGFPCASNVARPFPSLLLHEYESQVAETDVLDTSDTLPVLHGLYGEVGGIMSTVKKHVREGPAYPGFRKAAEEEFGDTLWYLTALCRRLHISLSDIFAEATQGEAFRTFGAASDIVAGAFAHVSVPSANDSVDMTLFRLGRSAAELLESLPSRTKVVSFARDYLGALHAAKISFADVASANVIKARGSFVTPAIESLEDFDKEFPPEEQLPRTFKIRVNQRGAARSYLQWNGVFIGDPLTDNIADKDGYRFHDVFHFAHAAILHWSPVMRALIKHKRKSRPQYDEEQDSGRAIVVEEGLTAWIFSRSKDLHYFDGQNRVSLDILKTISQFVAGYEVEKAPPKLWERAILDGYSAFRQLREAEGGWLIGDRRMRTIRFEALGPHE
jgi:hypothetical protein